MITSCLNALLVFWDDYGNTTQIRGNTLETQEGLYRSFSKN